MRVFVQSLDGEARKWFKELTPRSIANIEALDDVFLKHWGDKKDLLYYHTEFGNLKRENGESLPDFNKRFNHMYSKILAEVKPIPISAKLTYANAFDSDFCLLLRERRFASLAEMQDAALEVESNIMATEKLRSHADRRRQRSEDSSSSLSSEPKLDKMTKMIESLAAEISKLKVEQSFGKAMLPSTFAPINLNPFRRANEQLGSWGKSLCICVLCVLLSHCLFSLFKNSYAGNFCTGLKPTNPPPLINARTAPTPNRCLICPPEIQWPSFTPLSPWPIASVEPSLMSVSSIRRPSFLLT